MIHNNTPIQPGEISLILGEDVNLLSHHACLMAKHLADKGVAVQLLNCGMTTRRFWHIARQNAARHITERYGSSLLAVQTAQRGQLYVERDVLKQTRERFRTRVLIICGWEWASKSWRLKEDLLFHLREIAEEEDIAIIIYSQARTNPKQGCIDRGGVGKLASLAIAIERIDEDEFQAREPEQITQVQVPVEPSVVVAKLDAGARSSDYDLNDLDEVRAEEGELEEELVAV